jgi:hypothetical protein
MRDSLVLMREILRKLDDTRLEEADLQYLKLKIEELIVNRSKIGEKGQ